MKDLVLWRSLTPKFRPRHGQSVPWEPHSPIWNVFVLLVIWQVDQLSPSRGPGQGDWRAPCLPDLGWVKEGTRMHLCLLFTINQELNSPHHFDIWSRRRAGRGITRRWDECQERWKKRKLPELLIAVAPESGWCLGRDPSPPERLWLSLVSSAPLKHSGPFVLKWGERIYMSTVLYGGSQSTGVLKLITDQVVYKDRSVTFSNRSKNVIKS